MKDIIQTHRDSVKKKSRGVKTSPDVVPFRRRSFSDGADSDAPPVLTLTIPSSEELGEILYLLFVCWVEWSSVKIISKNQNNNT